MLASLKNILTTKLLIIKIIDSFRRMNWEMTRKGEKNVRKRVGEDIVRRLDS